MAQSARLEVNGKSIDLQLTIGSEDEVGMDVSQLRNQTGAITLDYGYANTGATESSITYIDGEAGILRYRGYPIEQLAEDSSFVEVSYLLNYGELPNEKQLKEFADGITIHTLMPERLRGLFNGFTKDAHPMGILCSTVAALSTYYPPGEEFSDEGAKVAFYRLMGKLPTIAAAAYKFHIGQPQVFPNNALDFTDNLLNMMFALPTGPYDIHPDVSRALDVLLILHADHEQNCSTSTVRLVGSSQANVYAAVSAGIGALWGPLHGGANQAVLEMLAEIEQSHQSLEQFIQEVKDKDSHSRLMGFGHRVYKNFDPRAKLVKGYADKVLNLLGVNDPLLELGKKLEEVALSDDYFIERKLYPNVDFYSGIIYRALGIPTNMFTVMFAIGRLPGWFAHWREQHDSPKSKIGRPRQIYMGEKTRDYIPLQERK